MSQNTSSAVMAQRSEAADSLDFFPTPPWATRALVAQVLAERLSTDTAWEPAAGEGHMAEVLRESFATVHASDVHDYGCGYAVGSFVGDGADRAACPFRPDWIITNPPFNLAEDFAIRAIQEAGVGVALLLRVSWLETSSRYRKIFARMPSSNTSASKKRTSEQCGSTATC